MVLIDDARSDVIVLLIIVIIFISLINTIYDHHDPHHDRVYISFNPKYWLVLFRLFMSLLSIFFQPFSVVSHVPHLPQMERRHPDLFQKSWDPRLTFQHGGFLSLCQLHGFLTGRVWVFPTFRGFLFVTSWVLEQWFSTPTVEMIPNWRFYLASGAPEGGCEISAASSLPIWIGGVMALRFEADPLCWQFPGGESWRLSHRGFVLP